jgi:hypothetical protein
MKVNGTWLHEGKMTSLPATYTKDVQYLRLAREIAADLHKLDAILKNSSISQEEFEEISKDPRFVTLLKSEIEAWNSAGNTHERTKLKAGMLMEEWLLEANARLHDAKEPLNSKTEVAKLLARLAGMGSEKADLLGGGGERFSITINLGADSKLQFQKELPAKVIEGALVTGD